MEFLRTTPAQSASAETKARVAAADSPESESEPAVRPLLCPQINNNLVGKCTADW